LPLSWRRISYRFSHATRHIYAAAAAVYAATARYDRHIDITTLRLITADAITLMWGGRCR